MPDTLCDVLCGVRWIFFDVGYTLFDETPAWQHQFESISAYLKTLGREVSVEQVWQTFREACRSFAPRQWLAVVDAYAESPEQAAAIDALAHGWKQGSQTVYPGTADLLEKLSARYRVGVIANQSLGTADRLRERGLLHYFQFVIGSAEAGVQKPDPKIFELALEQAGCAPGEAVMVGDRIDNDIAPANALGWKTVHVLQGGGALQTPRSPIERPTATVGAIAEIGPLFGV